MSDIELFEEWYGRNCLPEHAERLFERNDKGYKLMQARMAYVSFCAGLEAARKNDKDIGESNE